MIKGCLYRKAFWNTRCSSVGAILPWPLSPDPTVCSAPTRGAFSRSSPTEDNSSCVPFSSYFRPGLFFQMLRTNSGIQNKFAQEVLIFFRGDGHLISVGSCVPNLTQQCLSAGCVVYVWKAKTLCSAKATKPVALKTLVQSRAQDCTQPSLITQNKS